MAKVADVKVTVLDLAARRVRVTGTVTDEETGRVVAAEILDTVLDLSDLPGERVRITNGLMDDYAAKNAKQDQIDALLNTWQAALTNDLQARIDE